MEPEVLKRPTKKRSILLIAIAILAAAVLLSAAAGSAALLQSSTIHSGVRVGTVDASGMTSQSLEQALEKKYQSGINDLEITLKTDKQELKTTYHELNVHYDIRSAAESAYAVGRTGNVFSRLYDIAQSYTKGTQLDVPLSSDDSKLDDFINRFYEKTFVKVTEGSLAISDDQVLLLSGIHGQSIDREKTKGQIKAMIAARKGGTVDPELILTAPKSFDIDDLYSQISSEPVNATYKVENGALTLTPHSTGRQVDKAQLKSAVEALEKTENTARVLPVEFTQPTVTTEQAQSVLFRDVLAKGSSTFSTGTVNGQNRGFNIELAAEKINNLVLAPGDEFSYNKVVGPREEEFGFKIAHVYSAGQIIDGVGGGICQVSSTMYGAVLRADLDVVERRNHSFTVGYVPLGQDATAYYGGTDFRFKNSTNWPIKLLVTVKRTKISFAIMGTNETPTKQVIIGTKILSETPFVTKYIDDPTLPAGTEQEKLPGMKGYVVETYKTIKIDGEIVSSKKLHTSTYKVYDQEMLRGTKPVPVTGGSTSSAAVSAPSADPAAQETEQSTPVQEDILDEADQPIVD